MKNFLSPQFYAFRFFNFSRIPEIYGINYILLLASHLSNPHYFTKESFLHLYLRSIEKDMNLSDGRVNYTLSQICKPAVLSLPDFPFNLRRIPSDLYQMIRDTVLPPRKSQLTVLSSRKSQTKDFAYLKLQLIQTKFHPKTLLPKPIDFTKDTFSIVELEIELGMKILKLYNSIFNKPPESAGLEKSYYGILKEVVKARRILNNFSLSVPHSVGEIIEDIEEEGVIGEVGTEIEIEDEYQEDYFSSSSEEQSEEQFIDNAVPGFIVGQGKLKLTDPMIFPGKPLEFKIRPEYQASPSQGASPSQEVADFAQFFLTQEAYEAQIMKELLAEQQWQQQKEVENMPREDKNILTKELPLEQKKEEKEIAQEKKQIKEITQEEKNYLAEQQWKAKKEWQAKRDEEEMRENKQGWESDWESDVSDNDIFSSESESNELDPISFDAAIEEEEERLRQETIEDLAKVQQSIENESKSWLYRAYQQQLTDTENRSSSYNPISRNEAIVFPTTGLFFKAPPSPKGLLDFLDLLPLPDNQPVFPLNVDVDLQNKKDTKNLNTEYQEIIENINISYKEVMEKLDSLEQEWLLEEVIENFEKNIKKLETFQNHQKLVAFQNHPQLTTKPSDYNIITNVDREQYDAVLQQRPYDGEIKNEDVDEEDIEFIQKLKEIARKGLDIEDKFTFMLGQNPFTNEENNVLDETVLDQETLTDKQESILAQRLLEHDQQFWENLNMNDPEGNDTAEIEELSLHEVSSIDTEDERDKELGQEIRSGLTLQHDEEWDEYLTHYSKQYLAEQGLQQDSDEEELSQLLDEERVRGNEEAFDQYIQEMHGPVETSQQTQQMHTELQALREIRMQLLEHDYVQEETGSFDNYSQNEDYLEQIANPELTYDEDDEVLSSEAEEDIQSTISESDKSVVESEENNSVDIDFYEDRGSFEEVNSTDNNNNNNNNNNYTVLPLTDERVQAYLRRLGENRLKKK